MKPSTEMKKSALLKVRRVHEYLTTHDRSTQPQISAALGVSVRMVQKYIWVLRDGGYVVMHPGPSIPHGKTPALYSVTGKPMPATLPPQSHRTEKPRLVVDPVVKRRFVPAQQIGIHRDPLVAALFGKAVQA